MGKKREITTTTIRIPSENHERVQQYAEKMGLSQNQLYSNLIEIGLDDLRLLNSLGVLVVGRGVRDLLEKIRKGEIPIDEQGKLEL